MRATMLVLVVAVAGCGGETLSSDEAVVRKWVLDRAAKPETVVFEKWGPHIKKSDGLMMIPGYGPIQQPMAFDMVRVVYRIADTDGKVARRDELFFMRDGYASGTIGNPHGDTYRERSKQAVSDFKKLVEKAHAEDAQEKRERDKAAAEYLQQERIKSQRE